MSPAGKFLIYLLLFLALGVSSPLAAEETPAGEPPAPVEVLPRVDRSEVRIGDPLRYEVEVRARKGLSLTVPILAGSLGEFTITDFGDTPPEEKEGEVRLTRWYRLAAFTPGRHTLPGPTILYREGEEENRSVHGADLTVEVVSLVDGDPAVAPIRGLKPLEELPFDWRPIGLGAGGFLLLVGLVGGLWFFVNRPRRAYRVPPPPPGEVALAALRRLHADRLLDEGRFEAFYVELTAITRRYIEDRFEVRAPEMTTEEFLSTASGEARLGDARRRLLGEFLGQADLVKFARAQPSRPDCEAAFAAAQRFVEETTGAEPEATHA